MCEFGWKYSLLPDLDLGLDQCARSVFLTTLVAQAASKPSEIRFLGRVSHLMKIHVRQMSGQIVVLEVMEDTTVSEFKEQLRGWHPSNDDLIRRLSTVDVILGETKLTQDDETIAKAGISPEAVVHVH